MPSQRFLTKVQAGFTTCLLLHLISCSIVVAENQDTLKNATGASDNTSTAVKLPSELPSSTTSEPTTEKQTSPIAPTQVATATQVEQEIVPTIPHFIHKLMVRFGETKAAEALQSLDQLPLGLVMKILLVEIDKTLASDIVAMQRYAQSTDKALIMMIGRIVAGDKNVPKEIFAMDLKLMKFPWWVRIRERMLSNLEKYVAAYSLVPVAAKTALNGAAKSAIKAPEPTLVGQNTELAAAVAASATESSNKIIKQVAAAVAPAPANANTNVNLESLRVSLLNPVQQQQLLGTLALAKAAAANNAQAQQLFLKTQQATNINPFLLL